MQIELTYVILPSLCTNNFGLNTQSTADMRSAEATELRGKWIWKWQNEPKEEAALLWKVKIPPVSPASPAMGIEHATYFPTHINSLEAGSSWPQLLVTVFLSCFVTFLRLELKFSKLPVKSSHHCVTYAHPKSSLSSFSTSCKCFGTSIQMIIYNSLRFAT